MCAIAYHAFAADVKFQANLDRNDITIGESTQLGLTFYGTQSMPAPDIGSIDGLDIHYIGPSTMMTVINGQVSSSITHMYSAVPLKTGRFQIGPFSFIYKGDTYSSNIVFFEGVEAGKASGYPPTQASGISRVKEEPLEENIDLANRLFLNLEVDKSTAFVNELIPMTIKLYVNRLNVSDIQLPVFAQEGFSKVEFKEPRQYKEEFNRLIYDVLEFKTSIFGTRSGDYLIGPAKVKCNLVVRKRLAKATSSMDDYTGDDRFRDSFFEDFFTHYEKHPLELKTETIKITILPLPNQGKPQDFSGAIGDYQFIFSANPKKVKTGDPVTLKMDINGKGNFNTVLVPKLDSTEGFKVYEAQVKTEENRKTFSQVLIPETDQISQTPKAIFSYFDPRDREYKTITQGPVQIQVEKGKEEAPAQVIGISPTVSSSREPEELRRDIIYIKESPAIFTKKDKHIYKNKIFVFIIILPLLFLISIYIIHSKNERVRRDTRYARRIKAYRLARKGIRSLRREIKTGDQKLFYETLFKTLQDYLGDRLYIPSGGITSDVVDSALSPKGIDPKIIGRARSIFDICDKARFAFSSVDEFRMNSDLKDLEDVIDYFERVKII